VAESPAPAPKAPSGDAPKEVGARHVLVQYVGAERAPASVVRTREQAEALAQKVLAKARRGESFTRLATEYSDEPGAAGRGGALGKFGRGKMAPAFEEAAFRLAVGEVSNVVETPFGFHVDRPHRVGTSPPHTRSAASGLTISLHRARMPSP
jgi:hypothetical protein